MRRRRRKRRRNHIEKSVKISNNGRKWLKMTYTIAIGKVISVRQIFLYRWRTHHCPHGDFFFLTFLSFITGFYSFYNSNLPHKNANYFMNLMRICNLSDRHGRQTDRQKDRQTHTDRQTDGNLLGCEHMSRRYSIGLLLYSDSKSL